MTDKPIVDQYRTVAAKAVDHLLAVEVEIDGIDYAEPGTTQRTHPDYKDHLVFACPGCGKSGSIRISPPPKQKHAWVIAEGSPDDPTTLTLSPSINCVGCCKWHGHLKKGVFESVDNPKNKTKKKKP